MDNKTVIIQTYEGSGFTLIQFQTIDLAVFSYYLESEGKVLLIDPTIETSAYRRLALARKATIQAVFLTHIHADFLSGHLEFQGCRIYIGKGVQTNFNPIYLEDNQLFTLGSVSLRAIYTPGHTLESTCLLLTDSLNSEFCVFTGDTLFLGGVGRPDLAAKQDITEKQLASLLFDSLQKLKALPPQTRVYPAHGAGSSCGKSIDQGNVCTIGAQSKKNYALLFENRDDFIKEVIIISPPPLYFSYNSKLNKEGPFPYEKHLKQAMKGMTVDEYIKQIKQGAIVIDFRSNIKELQKGCIKGSINMPAVGKIALYIGSMYSFEQQLVIYCENQQREDLVQRLFRIGYINIKGYNDFNIEQWVARGYQIHLPKYATIQQMQNSAPNRLILDVRTRNQWQQTGILQDARTVYFPDLQQDIIKHRQQYQNKQIFTHCRMGYRARIANSILENNGIHNSLIIPDSWPQISKCKIPVVKYE